jgi:hypothetical protein
MYKRRSRQSIGTRIDRKCKGLQQRRYLRTGHDRFELRVNAAGLVAEHGSCRGRLGQLGRSCRLERLRSDGGLDGRGRNNFGGRRLLGGGLHHLAAASDRGEQHRVVALVTSLVDEVGDAEQQEDEHQQERQRHKLHDPAPVPVEEAGRVTAESGRIAAHYTEEVVSMQNASVVARDLQRVATAGRHCDVVLFVEEVVEGRLLAHVHGHVGPTVEVRVQPERNVGLSGGQTSDLTQGHCLVDQRRSQLHLLVCDQFEQPSEVTCSLPGKEEEGTAVKVVRSWRVQEQVNLRGNYQA